MTPGRIRHRATTCGCLQPYCSPMGQRLQPCALERLQPQGLEAATPGLRGCNPVPLQVPRRPQNPARRRHRRRGRRRGRGRGRRRRRRRRAAEPGPRGSARADGPGPVGSAAPRAPRPHGRGACVPRVRRVVKVDRRAWDGSTVVRREVYRVRPFCLRLTVWFEYSHELCLCHVSRVTGRTTKAVP